MLSNNAPGPDRASLHFDAHQFGGPRPSNRSVSAASHISHGDYASMHQELAPPMRHARWIPAWAASDSALRLVIMVRVFSYTQHGKTLRKGGGTLPKSLQNDYVKISRLADAYFAESITNVCPKAVAAPAQKLISARHKEAVQRAGGYAALTAAISFRSFRLGWKSQQIAESLGVTASMVRQQIFRLREVARALKLESPDENRHWTAGVPLAPHRVRLVKRRMRSKAALRA